MVKTYRHGRGLLENVTPKVNEILGVFGVDTITHGWGPGTTPDHNNLRCYDFMVPSINAGDRVAGYLISHSGRLGVEGIIFNGRVMGFPENGSAYRGPSKTWRKYTGPSPHRDHLHVQFNNKRYIPPTPKTKTDLERILATMDAKSISELMNTVIPGSGGVTLGTAALRGLYAYNAVIDGGVGLTRRVVQLERDVNDLRKALQ